MPNPAETFAAQPQTLRRAIAFIGDNAHRVIGLGDIATAIGVTGRSVQYTFRRHLGTTPLQYLRRVRLDRAHRDPPVVAQRRAQWCGSVSQGRSPRG